MTKKLRDKDRNDAANKKKAAQQTESAVALGKTPTDPGSPLV
jgi:hypothetical protein